MLEDATSELAKLQPANRLEPRQPALISRWRTSGWRSQVRTERMRQEFLADVSHD